MFISRPLISRLLNTRGSPGPAPGLLRAAATGGQPETADFPGPAPAGALQRAPGAAAAGPGLLNGSAGKLSPAERCGSCSPPERSSS